MTTIPARPTTYKGIRMRSRLEAGFAQHLDEIFGFGWSYEPECFADEQGQYLPDFEQFGSYIEVKPHGGNHNIGQVLARMHIIRSTHPTAPLSVMEGAWTGSRYGWRLVAVCSQEHPCLVCVPRTTGPLGEVANRPVDLARAHLAIRRRTS